tara:strand:- start:289 stop:678 length:390 start_codon:yes stop_codon:yes gene_type:complete
MDYITFLSMSWDELLPYLLQLPQFQLWLILYIASCILLANPLYHFTLRLIEKSEKKEEELTRRKFKDDPDWAEEVLEEDRSDREPLTFVWNILNLLLYIFVPMIFATIFLYAALRFFVLDYWFISTFLS